MKKPAVLCHHTEYAGFFVCGDEVMGKFIDLTGRKFGKLTALQRVKNDGKRVMWKCRCECGREVIVRAYHLTSGHSKSCGCIKRKNNGMYGTRISRIWRNMINRCYCKGSTEYHRYGERGIKVCDEWRNDFMDFYNWAMSHGYRDDLSIDRIDVNGNYEPSNCRWVTQKEQANNTRTNHYVTYNWKTHTISEWGEITGISCKVLSNRLTNLGWDAEKALTTPVRPLNRKCTKISNITNEK